MGFFDLFATKVDAAVPVEAANVDAAAIAPYYSEVGNLFLFGGVITASRAEAMSVPTVARALGIIQTIGSLPMHTRNEATGEKVSQPRVINQPDPRIPGTTFWSWIISDLFFFPSAYAYVMDRYADTGKIRAMERVAPERVTIQTNGMGYEIVSYQIDGAYVDPANLVVFQYARRFAISRRSHNQGSRSTRTRGNEFCSRTNPTNGFEIKRHIIASRSRFKVAHRLAHRACKQINGVFEC
jgi:hypothetical protein